MKPKPMKPAGRLLNAFGDWVLCSACLRIRVSLIHGLARVLGMCPGDGPDRGGRWSVE